MSGKSVGAYFDRFLDLSSRVPTLSDTEARFALVNILNTEVQVHMLGQHHCPTFAAAMEELRVYGHAQRGSHPTGYRANFGSPLLIPSPRGTEPTPCESSTLQRHPLRPFSAPTLPRPTSTSKCFQSFSKSPFLRPAQRPTAAALLALPGTRPNFRPSSSFSSPRSYSDICNNGHIISRPYYHCDLGI